jgi:RimJ/RimL family protein N-acetyltransferase
VNQVRIEASVIRLERLDLVLLSAPLLQELVAGRRDRATALLGADIPAWWPDAHDLRFLKLRLEQVERDPTVRKWLVRGLVLREAKSLVGHAGFHGPPGVNGPRTPGAVEIGYTVFPPFRGRGYAQEAAAGLTRWAREEHGISTFIASVAPDNAPSLAVVRKLGFRQVGEQWDKEDGLELVFQLDGEPSSMSAPSSGPATTISEPASPVEQWSVTGPRSRR